MELVRIYECLCDRTRLRLLNLLLQGPLCVCHFQVVLGEPQVKISKHLNYLRRRGLVTARREGNWMIYSLPEKMSRELRANLACLQDCAREQPVFKRDLARRAQRGKKFAATSPCGCGVGTERRGGRTRRRRAVRSVVAGVGDPGPASTRPATSGTVVPQNSAFKL